MVRWANPLSGFPRWGGLCVIHNVRGETNKAMDLAEQLLDLARDTHHSPHLLAAHSLMAHVCFFRGDFSGTRDHEEEAIRLYEPGQYGEHEYHSLFVHDQVAALGILSWALCALGYPEQALTRSREAIALARELSHPFSEANALLYAGSVHSQLREGKSCLETADAVIAPANEHGFPDFTAGGTYQRVDALMELGEMESHEGIAVMRALIDAARAMGSEMASQSMLPHLAERYGEVGQVEEGLALVAEALEVIGNTGVRVLETEVNRVKGELILARPSSDHEEAEACFHKAIDVARSQSAKFFEQRPCLPASGRIGVVGMRPASYSHPFTAGSPRASTHGISRRPRHFSTSWREPVQAWADSTSSGASTPRPSGISPMPWRSLST